MAMKSSSVCALEPKKITKTKWAQWYGTPCNSPLIFNVSNSKRCNTSLLEVLHWIINNPAPWVVVENNFTKYYIITLTWLIMTNWVPQCNAHRNSTPPIITDSVRSRGRSFHAREKLSETVCIGVFNWQRWARQ